jgi:hypothetical protein
VGPAAKDIGEEITLALWPGHERGARGPSFSTTWVQSSGRIKCPADCCARGPEEATEILETVTRLCPGDFQIGETPKTSRAHAAQAAAVMGFGGSASRFTGTFVLGRTKDDEKWAHSSSGRKIGKAVDLRSLGVPIAIRRGNSGVRHP